MAAVNSAPAFQPFESRGYAIGSPQIQIESAGTVTNPVSSVLEALKALMPTKYMAYESTATSITADYDSPFEALLSVRRVF